MMATRTSGMEPPRSLTTEYDTAHTLSAHKKACRGVACPSTHPTHPEKVTPFENMRYTLKERRRECACSPVTFRPYIPHHVGVLQEVVVERFLEVLLFCLDLVPLRLAESI